MPESNQNDILVLKELADSIGQVKGLVIEKILGAGTYSLRLEILDETGEPFSIILKETYNDFVALNIISQIEYAEDDLPVTVNIMNHYNSRSMGVKGVVHDENKKRVLFMHEDAIKLNDRFNIAYIADRITLALTALKDTLEVYYNCAMDKG